MYEIIRRNVYKNILLKLKSNSFFYLSCPFLKYAHKNYIFIKISFQFDKKCYVDSSGSIRNCLANLRPISFG